MMKSFIVSRTLAILSGIGGAAFGSLILAAEPSTNQAPFVPPTIAAVSVAEESQRPPSFDATGSKTIKREIRELHEEVRVLRRDVNRLIELLQNLPTEAKTHVQPVPDQKPSSNESKQKNEILSGDAEPISDEFVWERLGIRMKPAKVESGRFRGGLEVLAVRSGSPASQQGFRVGDVLVGLGTWETIGRNNLDYVLRKLGLKNEATLKFYLIRDGATLFGHLALPAVQQADNANEAKLHSPMTESNPEDREVWDLTLNKAIRIAFENSQVMRSLGAVPRAIGDSDKNIVLTHSDSGKSTTEIAIAARNLVSDVEESYWKLWKARQDLESARDMRDSAQKTWKVVWERFNQGVVDSFTKAQADQQYFDFRSKLEKSLHELHQRELQMRKVLALAERDGRLIHPMDKPSTNQVKLDWNDVHANALANSFELSQQRRVIEQCEIQLASARQELPETLPGSTTGLTPEEAAFLNFSLPVGHRRAMARVRNLQLKLAREKARLEEMELNTFRLLATAIRELDSTAASSQMYLSRATAAKAELEAATALFLRGKSTLETLLESQRRNAETVEQYHVAIGGHAIAIKDVNLQRGTLLQHRGVVLEEGPSSEDTK